MEDRYDIGVDIGEGKDKDNGFVLTFGPIMNAPWAIDGRRRIGIEGMCFVVKGMAIGDIGWLDVYPREAEEEINNQKID